MTIPSWLTFGAEGWGIFFAALIWLSVCLLAGIIAIILWAWDVPRWLPLTLSVLSIVGLAAFVWLIIVGG